MTYVADLEAEIDRAISTYNATIRRATNVLNQSCKQRGGDWMENFSVAVDPVDPKIGARPFPPRSDALADDRVGNVVGNVPDVVSDAIGQPRAVSDVNLRKGFDVALNRARRQDNHRNNATRASSYKHNHVTRATYNHNHVTRATYNHSIINNNNSIDNNIKNNNDNYNQYQHQQQKYNENNNNNNNNNSQRTKRFRNRWKEQNMIKKTNLTYKNTHSSLNGPLTDNIKNIPATIRSNNSDIMRNNLRIEIYNDMKVEPKDQSSCGHKQSKRVRTEEIMDVIESHPEKKKFKSNAKFQKKIHKFQFHRNHFYRFKNSFPPSAPLPPSYGVNTASNSNRENASYHISNRNKYHRNHASNIVEENQNISGLKVSIFNELANIEHSNIIEDDQELGVVDESGDSDDESFVNSVNERKYAKAVPRDEMFSF